VTIAKFRPATHNANRHTQRGLKALQDSMRSVGYTEPMVAAADGEMLSGTARLESVADVFGVEVEPIIVTSDGTRPIIHVRSDIPNAQTPAAQRIAIASNRVAELDLSWDVEVLAGLGADVLQDLWTPEELSALGDYENPQLKEAAEAIRPRPMFRVLISAPIDNALDLRSALEALAEIDGIEILYGANG
jgi:hypothetical protein